MKIKKYLTTFKISVRNTLFYLKNVLGGFIMYALFVYVFFLLWTAVYKGGEIEGYSIKQMIWYFCITEVLAMSIGGAGYQISTDIKSGSIAYELGRPYSYIWYRFSNSMGATFINLSMFTVLAAVLGILLVGAPYFVVPLALPFFVISVILAIVLQFFISMLIGLTAFYVEESRPYFFIYSKLVLILGTFLPIEFFPDWMSGVLRYMPFTLASWGPAKIFVDFSLEHAVHTLSLLVIWCAVFMALTFGVYLKGVKKINVHGG